MWLMLVGLSVSLTYNGYYGVKDSNPGRLLYVSVVTSCALDPRVSAPVQAGNICVRQQSAAKEVQRSTTMH